MKKILIHFISIYQKYLSFDRGLLMVLAPGGTCRHDVTCSQYTKGAISQHGVLKGLGLGLKRIWSCR